MAANAPVADVLRIAQVGLMRTLFSSATLWLVGALVILFFVVLFGWSKIPTLFGFAGSVVVIDETRGVETAVVTDGYGTEQKLHRLRDGYFYAIPQIEGVIEVRCANGVRKQKGYVTGGLDTTVKVVGRSPCEGLVHSDMAARNDR